MAHTVMGTQVTGYVVTASDWNEIVNNFIAGATDAMTANGDIWVGTGTNAGVKLAAFTSSTGTLKQESGGLEFDSSGVVLADMIKGSGTGTWAILTKGAGNSVLTMNSGATDFAWTALAAAVVVREGGQTTEATTTSTSATDLSTVSSITIDATQLFLCVYDGRKTTGAGAGAGCGLKQNSTSILPPTTATSSARGWTASTANNAENGQMHAFSNSKVANHLNGKWTGVMRTNAGTGGASTQMVTRGDADANWLTAQMTTLIIQGISGDGAITLGVDEVHVFSFDDGT